MNDSNNIKNKSNFHILISESNQLKNLASDIQKSLVTEQDLILKSVKSFNWLSKSIYKNYGFEIVLNQKLRKKPFSRKKCLLHKLIEIHKQLAFAKRNRLNFQKLTKREIEILQLLSKGKNNPKISDQLFISRCTVEQHRKNINRKLKIKSFAHLMRYAYAFDLI